MESFADIVNGFLSLHIFTKSFIFDVRKSSENASSKQVQHKSNDWLQYDDKLVLKVSPTFNLLFPILFFF